jgi:hypothetical protein
MMPEQVKRPNPWMMMMMMMMMMMIDVRLWSSDVDKGAIAHPLL